MTSIPDTSAPAAARPVPVAVSRRRARLLAVLGGRRRRGLIAIVLLGLGLATVVQSFSWNQTSHYALVRSIAHGTPQIDHYQDQTGDKAFFEGHWYSSRAPGLALISVPWYGALTAIDAPKLIRRYPAQRNDDAMIWAVGLWGNVIPAVLLMLLVRWLAERVEPGYGTAAAITVGLGTLLLPLGTLLFSHILSALLGLASFGLLWRARETPQPLWPVALAGLLVGYAMTVEYPLMFVAIVLGVYLLSGRRPLLRAGVYTACAAVGLLPLAAYDRWAFGSIWHVAYADLPPHQSGFFGIRPPSLSVAASLLFSSRGLLTLTPILIMSLVGLLLMRRRGHRAEAAVIAAVVALYLVYNSGYYLPFGGAVPGPRFLSTMLPFLGIPLALAYRRYPGPTITLAAASCVTMVLATLTHPLVGYQPETAVWTRFAANGDFQPTILTALGAGRGYLAILPFIVLAGAAIALSMHVTEPLSIDRRALVGGSAAVLSWAIGATFLPALLGIDASSEHKIAEAGDPVAAASQYGSHPIGHLCALALSMALLALMVARLRQRPAAFAGRWARAS